MEGLTLANKLTLRHINYSENKMKCKLAAQMLSNSVADALIYLQKSKYPGFEDCLGTAEFCKMFDMLLIFVMFEANTRKTIQQTT